VFELAAISGLDPWPLTLRELMSAAKKKAHYDWNFAADQMALIASANCGGKTFQRSDFHPFMQPAEETGNVDPRAEYRRVKRKEAKRKKEKESERHDLDEHD
jgi:hypothetical protein